MKKTLAIICAVAMALSMFAVFAYTIGDGANATEFQFKVIDIRAVDFQNTKSGLNPVGSLDKNEKLYVQGDEIEVAVIFEMKNAAKFNVIPIDEDEWGGLAVFVTSSTVDFSYAPHNVVKCASDLWVLGGNQGSFNIDGGFAIASTGGRILYDSKDNMVVFGIKALPRQGASENTLLRPARELTTTVPPATDWPDLNLWVIYNPVTSLPYGLTYQTGIFTVPAYYERNSTFKFTGGTLTFPAPDIIEYAVIFFGRTKAPLTPSNKGELKVLSMIDAGTTWVQVKDTKDVKVFSVTGWPVMKLDAGDYTIFKYKEDADSGYFTGDGPEVYDVNTQLATYTWDVNKALFNLGNYALPYIAPAVFDVTVGQLATGTLRANLADDSCTIDVFGGPDGIQNAPADLLAIAGGITQAKYKYFDQTSSKDETVYLPVTGFGLTKYGYTFYPTYGQSTPLLPVLTDVMDQDDLAAIVLYTVVDNNKSFPLVTLATEAGPLSVRSIAAFDAWANRLSEDRGVFKYESVDADTDTSMTTGNHGTGLVDNWVAANFVVGKEAYRSADILKVFRTLSLNTGIEYTYKITDDTFNAFIKAAVYEDLLVREYNYGTATIILPEDEVEEGNEEEDFDEDDGEELPETGDASIAIAIMATAIIACAALAFVLKKAR